MLWEPVSLAIALGLVISAGLWLVLVWPSQEPPDDD